MNKKHYQQSCGCLLMSLMIIGTVVCAAMRVADEIKKHAKLSQKTEQRTAKQYRIMPSECR